MRLDIDRVQAREWLIIVGPALALVLGAFWLTAQFIQPAPPSRITITTGGEGGAYFAFANRYKQVLARSGIELEIRTSAGSVENLKRIEDPGSGVAAAFLQGGVLEAGDHPELLSVGRLFQEPLWFFHRAPAPLTALTELKGLRIAIGPDGSGTQALVLKLLAGNRIGKADATLVAKGGNDAVEALNRGEIDGLFLVSAPEAPIVGKLLADPNSKLLSLSQAEAYSRIFPFLGHVVLPHGVVDLVKDVPAADVHLVAPTAALAVRADLHPALIELLTLASIEVHGGPGLLHRAGEFPQAADPELVVAEEARRVHANGPGFLQRYLPFWLANFIERSFLLIVPALTVLLPLFQAVPWLYKMRVRSRILYWYGQLKKVEQAVIRREDTANDEAIVREIDRIDLAVSRLPVPLPYVEQVYDLRGHIDMVRQRLPSRANHLPPLEVSVEATPA